MALAVAPGLRVNSGFPVTVSIYGDGFSCYDATASTRVGTAAQSSFWMSDSALMSKSVTNLDHAMPVRVTLAQRLGTRSQIVSFLLSLIKLSHL